MEIEATDSTSSDYIEIVFDGEAGAALAAALIALALEAGAAGVALDSAKTVELLSPQQSSGWHSTVMLRTWQINSDVLALNSEWMRRSIHAGRNWIPEEQMADFLDPQVPIEKLFTHIKPLGKGAFGATSLWRTQGGSLVAIKELDPKWGNGTSDFEIGLALDHSNIVSVHNFVQKWATPREMRRYLIMEYIDGETLRNQELTLVQRVALTREMLSSALYMFQRGVLPLDLHAGNLMVNRQGEWKWIDLGIYQPITAAGRLTLATYFKALARLVQNILQPKEEGEETDGHFPPLQQMIEMVADLPEYRMAMSAESIPLLENYCNILLNWLELYSQKLNASLATYPAPTVR